MLMSVATQNVVWYAARTRHGQEVGVKNRLNDLGVENFIPVRRQKTARGKATDRPIINSLVFIKTNKTEALELANYQGLPVKYMVDCATKTLLVVPDKQMEDFQRVLDESIDEGGLMDEPLSLGDKVRVTKGCLRGVEGYVLELLGRVYVVVSLCGCLYAKAQVPRAWLEKTDK